MLHPAILKGGKQGKIEFVKWEGNTGVVFQPAECRSVKVENGGFVARYLGRVRFPVIHVHDPPVSLGLTVAEVACGKSKQVGGNGFRGRKSEVLLAAPQLALHFCPVTHGLPVGRYRQTQTKTGLEVGLVKTGKEGGGAVGHQQGVQVLRIAVERLFTRHEGDEDAVFPFFEMRSRYADVIMNQFIINSLIVYGNCCDLHTVGPEVQDEGLFCRAQVEFQRCAGRYGSLLFERNVEKQVVVQVADTGSPVSRKFLRNAGCREKGVVGAAAAQQKQTDEQQNGVLHRSR